MIQVQVYRQWHLKMVREFAIARFGCLLVVLFDNAVFSQFFLLFRRLNNLLLITIFNKKQYWLDIN